MNWFRRRRPSDSELVGAFHEKFNLPRRTPETVPGFPEPDVLKFRTKFLEEELQEFKSACLVRNLPEAADALVDLVYVVLGTAHYLGLPWEELFDEVQRTNMLKRRAKSALQSKRGSVYDVVKPPGWKRPDLGSILRRSGWHAP